MTKAKLSVFIVADGKDSQDETIPLVRIIKGSPKMHVGPVRNADHSCDLRARPLFEPGWEVKLRVRWDADQFRLQDVSNLLMRVGLQVGIGEGRPDSPKSDGMGWGLFDLAGDAA